MAKTEQAPAADATKATDPEMTLDEFCARTSSKKVDGRVALIHGFAYTQRIAGVVKNTEAGFKEALKKYASQSPKESAAASKKTK